MRELRERAEPILKVVCGILAGVILWQLVGMTLRWNPFRGVTVPELPTLTASTNAPGGSMTNSVASAGKGTNTSRHSTGTNASGTNATIAAASSHTNQFSTNAVTIGTNVLSATNLIATTGTNAITNLIAKLESETAETNAVVSTNAAAGGTNVALSAAATNSSAQSEVELHNTNTISETTNLAAVKRKFSTNSAAATTGTNATNATLASATAGTNSTARKRGGPPPQMAGMNFSPFGSPGKSTVELPAAVKARISKITDSEILGPVMRPLPQALLGIAGNVAFLRSANGQTGLVKEGDSLDDLKLLRIGMNRVLVEQNGEKKEMLIFDGYGGESLMPKDSSTTNSPNENIPPK